MVNYLLTVKQAKQITLTAFNSCGVWQVQSLASNQQTGPGVKKEKKHDKTDKKTKIPTMNKQARKKLEDSETSSVCKLVVEVQDYKKTHFQPFANDNVYTSQYSRILLYYYTQ